jgi:hypothetical protein
VGAGATTGDPDSLDDLQLRRERHERLTRGPPARPFSSVLAAARRGGAPEPVPEPLAPAPPGAIDPHLGLDPRQDAALASGSGRRSATVIIKG